MEFPFNTNPVDFKNKGQGCLTVEEIKLKKTCEYKFKIYVLDRISVALLNAPLVARSYLTLGNPMNCQASLPMEFSRQEYWSGLPFPSPGDLP